MEKFCYEFNNSTLIQNSTEKSIEYWQKACNPTEANEWEGLGLPKWQKRALLCFVRQEFQERLGSHEEIKLCTPIISKMYFFVSLSVWFLPPLLYMTWVIKAVNDLYRTEILEKKKSMKVHHWILFAILFPFCFLGALFCSILVIYIKMPFDAVRHYLLDLGWIPASWGDCLEMKWMKFSNVKTRTHIQFMKLFEVDIESPAYSS